MAFFVMYYCYILYSHRINKYYIGSTADLNERLQRHNCSHKGFTSTGKPWEIKYYEVFESKGRAIRREMELKSYKDRNKLEELIRAGSEHPG